MHDLSFIRFVCFNQESHYRLHFKFIFSLSSRLAFHFHFLILINWNRETKKPNLKCTSWTLISFVIFASLLFSPVFHSAGTRTATITKFGYYILCVFILFFISILVNEWENAECACHLNIFFSARYSLSDFFSRFVLWCWFGVCVPCNNLPFLHLCINFYFKALAIRWLALFFFLYVFCLRLFCKMTNFRARDVVNFPYFAKYFLGLGKFVGRLNNSPIDQTKETTHL